MLLLKSLNAWAKAVFARRPVTRRRKRHCEDRLLSAAEVLEVRTMLTVTLAQPIINALPTTKDELVALPVTNTTANPVSFTVTSSNSHVTATVLTGGRSIDMLVSGVDANHNAFTGHLIFRLFENEEPITTARIIQLVNSNFYNGLTFHRIISGFVAQGGDPTGTGSGGSGTKFNDEFNQDLTFTSNGLLAMANSGDDTNDSQFFITAVDQSLGQLPQHLNFQHNIFGILTSGFDTFRKLMSTPTDANGKPATTETIISATVFTDTQNGVVRLHAAPGFTGNTTLTFTANDGQGSTSQKQASLAVVADTINDRPFLGPVTNQVTKQGTPVTFNVQGFDLEHDPLTFVVKDAASFVGDNSIGTNPANIGVTIHVTPASGNTPATAAITLTPQGTFSGTVNLIVGVRDGTNRGGTSLNSRINFDTQQITLTVNPVNHAPTTNGGSAFTQLNQLVSVQLTGDDGDPDKTQTLTFEIVTQPQHGSISNFISSTGALQYTPANNFQGLDTFTYRVHDNGGTANGGQDTSAVATFKIAVGAPTISGLAMDPASDDGVSHTDLVILTPRPVFTVSATAGSVVTLLVNGKSHVVAVETSPGQYRATLSRVMLQVGVNTVTATAVLNGVSSAPTDAATFNYAPTDVGIYTVPGAFGSAQQITFRFVSKDTFFRNELGVFAVDDLSGHVNGIAPGSAGYAAAALNSATRQIIFARGKKPGATVTLNVTGGELLEFYLVSSFTTRNFLRFNPHDRPFGIQVFFGLQAANRDHANHLLTTADPQTGQVSMGWEDRRFFSDHDFDDDVISLTPKPTSSPTVGNALRISGAPTSNVPVTFTLEPTPKMFGPFRAPPPSTAQGEIGFFVVSDNAGTVNGLKPGSQGYLLAALGSSTRQVLFHGGDPLNKQTTAQIPGGSLIAFYIIPGSTAASVMANNPNNDPNAGPVAFFSFTGENPHGAGHFRWFGPERSAVSSSAANGQLQFLLHIFGTLSTRRSPLDDYLIEISFPQ
jgi:cyclophilin family peptidyl-prolyl cis-trans isomerase